MNPKICISLILNQGFYNYISTKHQQLSFSYNLVNYNKLYNCSLPNYPNYFELFTFVAYVLVKILQTNDKQVSMGLVLNWYLIILFHIV